MSTASRAPPPTSWPAPRGPSTLARHALFGCPLVAMLPSEPVMSWLLLAAVPPSHSPSAGLFEFFMRSGAMAQVVLLTLVLFSLMSWSIMIWKYFQFRQAIRHGRQFLEIFHQSKRFSEVNAQSTRLAASPLVGLFQAGY